jgi:hypothetical protein
MASSSAVAMVGGRGLAGFALQRRRWACADANTSCCGYGFTSLLSPSPVVGRQISSPPSRVHVLLGRVRLDGSSPELPSSEATEVGASSSHGGGPQSLLRPLSCSHRGAWRRSPELLFPLRVISTSGRMRQISLSSATTAVSCGWVGGVVWDSSPFPT